MLTCTTQSRFVDGGKGLFISTNDPRRRRRRLVTPETRSCKYNATNFWVVTVCVLKYSKESSEMEQHTTITAMKTKTPEKGKEGGH